MKCKHCGQKIKEKYDYWIHITGNNKKFSFCNHGPDDFNKATPIEELIEKSETNDDFMEMLKAL